MRKKILMVTFMIVMIAISSIACNKEIPLTYYQNAVKKTDSITKGKMSVEILIENNYNVENITKEDMELIDPFKNIKVSFVSNFNDMSDRQIAYAYYNYNDVGYDFNIYSTEGNTYLKFPMNEQFIRIDAKEMEGDIDSEKLYQLSSMWIEILDNKDVAKGEQSILDTEDGEVKIVEYSINPTSEQMKPFIKEAITLMIDDNNDMFKIANIDEDSTNIKDDINSIIENIETVQFSERAFIDIDGYIVQSDINIEMNFKGNNAIKNTSVIIQSKNWDIEQEQILDYPEFTNENVIEIDSLKDFQILGGSLK